MAFTAAMVVMLVVLAHAVYGSIAAALLDELDSGLRFRAAVIAAPASSAAVERPQPLLQERGEAFDELVTSDGAVLRSSPGTPNRPLLDARTLRRVTVPQFFTREGRGRRLVRLLAVPIGGTDREVLVVGASLADRQDALRHLVNLFGLLGPAAVVIVSLVGWLVAGIGLRPVERMRAQAAAITTSGLELRLDVPPARDELRRLGATLNAMLERLQASSEADRRFLERASHELRTPLTALKAELDLARTEPDGSRALRRSVDSAREEVDHLVRLSNDLLVLARVDQGRLTLHRRECDLETLLGAATAAHTARASDHGVILETSVETDCSTVLLDPTRVRQAVDNLIDNALRHGSPRTISIAARGRADELVITVTDDGCGFPAPADLLRAVRNEPVGVQERSAHPETSGGMGLRIAHTVAASHEGELLVANDGPGGGAAVTLILRRTTPDGGPHH